MEPDHLSADLATPPPSAGEASTPVDIRRWGTPRNLAAAIKQVEKELIATTLNRTSGNISETARVLGLTRRGLYLEDAALGTRWCNSGYLVDRIS